MIKINKKKEAEKNNKQVLKETLIAEEAPELSLAEKLREKKKAKKKKNIKRMSWGGFAILFMLFLYWGFMPFQGTIPYAMCKILLEQNITYPETLHFTEVAELRTGATRLWFTHTDAFGAFRMESFICTFGEDPKTQQSIITQAKWGTVELDQQQLDNFNKIMPYLVSGNYYDLTYPSPLPDSIDDMKIETDKYRKVNLMELITQKK